MIVCFLSPLDVRKRSGRMWELLAPLVYTVDGDKRAVPAGFETNFASVPRLPLMFLLAGDTAHRAATVHDYLYFRAELPREECDEIFRHAMKAEEVSSWRAGLMHRAVRVGGGGAYGPAKHEAQTEKRAG